MPRVLVELIEIAQLARQDRDERNLDQVQATKELTRNLAHEIKNPLGGIRGAAQLLALELQDGDPELTEYTQVIVHEVDRLQSLVDRLLAPHRKAQVVGDVNIHEICERVRALVLIEHPKGLDISRDYDTSLPDFRGDREQLIQMTLNIVQNAAQVLVRASPQATRRSCCARASPGRSPLASSAGAWHWNCISRTTVPASPPRSGIASSSPWSRGETAARASDSRLHRRLRSNTKA